VQIMDATPSLNRFVFCPESEDFCAFKLFVSFIWRSLPLTESSILETSLVVGQGRELSFNDLCSLFPDSEGKTYASLLKHIHSKSTVGWLTENLVDCYIARTVEACNHLLGSLFFGCLDCCSVDGILRSAFSQSARSCPTITSIQQKTKCFCAKISFFQCCGSGTSP